MSKHKSYNEFYKPRKEEETKENVSEEVQIEEEAVEAPPEEKEEVTEAVEEIKVEEQPIVKKLEVVGADRVNLRVAPNKQAKVLTVLSKGEKVNSTYDGVGSTWTKVDYKEFTGYMMSMFLKEIR